MKLLRHPYVVKLFEVMISSRGIILVMEYVKGGDFFDKISIKILNIILMYLN